MATGVSYLIRWGECPRLNQPIFTAVSKYPRYLVTVEINDSKQYHTHILLDLDSSQTVRAATQTIVNAAKQCLPPGQDWGRPFAECSRLSILQSDGGSVKRINFDSMVRRYFVVKTHMPTHAVDWARDSKGNKTYIVRCTDPKTEAMFSGSRTPMLMVVSPSRSDCPSLRVNSPSLSVNSPSAMANRKRKGGFLSQRGKLMKLDVERMAKAGCATIDSLRVKLPDIFWNAVSKGQSWTCGLLKEARAKMVQDWSLQNYLVKSELVPSSSTYTPYPKNIITKVFEYQGYDPSFFCVNLARWSDLSMGKRNTINLWGVAGSGKTLIHKSLKICCPVTGTVNSSDNFPFNTVKNTLLISWEEGDMKESVVQQAKELLGGETCEVDREGRESETVTQTPVFLTTTRNPSYIQTNNTISVEHRTQLLLRMIQYEFGRSFEFNTPEFPGHYPSNKELAEAITACASWGKAYMEHLSVPYPTHKPVEFRSTEDNYIARLMTCLRLDD